MAIYDTLKTAISSVIYENANNEISGEELQLVLLDMVDVLGDYTFGGVITPTTEFTPTDRLYWFICSENGIYSDFNGLTVENEIAIITYNGSFAKYKLCNYYLPSLPIDSSLFLNGNGEFSTPTTPPNSHLKQPFTNVSSVVVAHGFGVTPIISCYNSDRQQFIPYSVVDNEAFTSTTIVFSRAMTGYIIANVGSPAPAQYLTKVADYTLLTTDSIVEAATSGITFTLPTAVGIENKIFEIINASNGAITVETSNSETIGNDVNATSSFVLQRGEVLKVLSNNINYRMI